VAKDGSPSSRESASYILEAINSADIGFEKVNDISFSDLLVRQIRAISERM